MDNAYTFRLDRWHIALIGSIASLLFITMGVGGYLLNSDGNNDGLYMQVLKTWEQRLQIQAEEVLNVRQQTHSQLQGLTKRLGELQAQFYQVEGLAQRLAEVAQLSPEELAQFNSLAYQQYALDTVVVSGGSNDFVTALDKIEAQITTRSEQLVILENLLLQRELTESMSGIGRIVDRGWISSPYGYRLHPISQKQAWHNGVDISGRAGTPIKAVAAGIVRFAGRRAGYGNLVEIDHGNGYSTLYAHNRNNLVVVGDIVNKGQMIAQMGSTGRSTGPHVHFEVLRNGNSLNPLPYIQAGYASTN